MKKHDFESTSKKNAKEQTPEMAEREQEILMWMGDIRDDFILEAEDYKHYQSDKSVPGYFILGGTLAAAAAICTAIFFQTGRNRIDHSNVPMQLPYQTEETKELIDKYANDSEYVFPVIDPSSSTTVYDQYRLALGRMNRHLKKIASQLHMNVRLTTYTARHTWATLARESGAPISIISAGLGHTSEEMTRVYLKDFDQEALAKVNRIVTNLL